jgi:hypothetical protein
MKYQTNIYVKRNELIEFGSERLPRSLPRGKRTNAERYCSLRIEDSRQLAAESFNAERKRGYAKTATSGWKEKITSSGTAILSAFASASDKASIGWLNGQNNIAEHSPLRSLPTTK